MRLERDQVIAMMTEDFANKKSEETLGNKLKLDSPVVSFAMYEDPATQLLADDSQRPADMICI